MQRSSEIDTVRNNFAEIAEEARRQYDELAARTARLAPQGEGGESGEFEEEEDWKERYVAAMRAPGPAAAEAAFGEPLSGGNFTAKPPEKPEIVPADPKGPQPNPPQIHPYLRGKLCM